MTTSGLRPRPRACALLMGAALVLTACGPTDTDVGGETPRPEPATPTATATDPTRDTPDPLPEPTPSPALDTPSPQATVEPLEGQPTTGEREQESEPGAVAVTDVRIASHEGFDRVVIDIAGDGAAGWISLYTEEATTAGRGAPIELEGEAVLVVALQGVTLPPDLPEDIDPAINERWQAPGGGVVREVVGDTVFEGAQYIFIGVDAELPFLVERLDDPQRVVVDVFHG